MKKWLILLMGTVLMTLCFTNLVFADWPKNMEGEPVALLRQDLEGYFIWHDDSGLHVTVATTNNIKHIFTGIIETDGRIENIMAKTLYNSDYCRLSNHDILKFQLSASDNAAETNFNIFYGQYVKFRLLMDGQKMDANKIYFGSDGWHPNNSTFSIYYNDDPRVHEHIIFDWWLPWPHPWPGPHRPRFHSIP